MIRFALISILVFASLRAWPQAEQALKVCAGEMYASQCEDLSKKPLDLRKSKTEADGALFNYFLVGKREYADTIRAFNSSASKTLADRGLEIAKDVRTEAIKIVMAGRSEKDLPPLKSQRSSNDSEPSHSH